jgi:protein gp37
MAITRIEWAESVWNPITGCTHCSPACDNCYAARMSKRLAGRFGYPADDPFRLTKHIDKTTEPASWKKPRRIFVGSMTDLFHEDVPFEWLDEIFLTMEFYSQHTYLLLTKRPQRMQEYLAQINVRLDDDPSSAPDDSPRHGDNPWPWPNVWIGTTVWDQASAEHAVPILLETPAARRFISVEPMLGAIDLTVFRHGCDEDLQVLGTSWGPDWVICGGETGPGARPMHPAWPRQLRDQCVSAGVPFFFKQHGEWVGLQNPDDGWWPTDAETCIRLTKDGHRADDGYPMQRVGKKHAGRKLDGQVWQEVPHA